MPTLADLAQMLGMGSTPTPPRRPNIYPMPAPGIAEAPSEWDPSLYGYGPDAYGRMTRAKGQGWMGPQQTPYGDTMTELSIGVPIFGTEMEIPTMVPTLTPAQVQTLLALQDGQPIPDDILKAAVKHAEMRVLQGQSPFAQPSDTRQKRKP